ncbi:hypothetical protein ABW19_dt0208136 [Dactylella cylindrospora]|nr:hypothetical protein ABW19_dt0208136 [Dactylella cylindrospora]
MVIRKGVKRKATGPSSAAAPAKTRRQKEPKTKAHTRRAKSSEQDYDDHDEDSDSEAGINTPDEDSSDAFEDTPKRSRRIPRKKEPEAEYTDETIHQLAMNNERDWFHANKDIYKIALADFKSFCTVLQEKVTEVDWTVPILPLERHNLFRIHRDIRFSSSKIPYKEYFSVAFSRTGKQGLYAKYYLSIQPGDQSFLGGGLWHPEATHVSLMRREIDRHPDRLKGILASNDFYGNFLNPSASPTSRVIKTAKGVRDLAVKRFVERNSEDALKTAPKGYDKTHPDINLLRLKSYTVGKRISDEEILQPNAMDYIVEIIRAMEPFITYLNSVVMPDIGLGQGAGNSNQNDDGDEDEDEEEEDGGGDDSHEGGESDDEGSD